MQDSMRIAVIGSGISGLGAAWALSKRHQVVLYEKAQRAGGHAHTSDIDYDGTRIAVDTGFIVYNETNYPNLVRLFAALGVETQTSDMSFGVSLDGGRLEWSGDRVGTLFAQKRNIFRPSHHAMWMDILRFNRMAPADLLNGSLEGLSLGAYLDRRRLGSAFRDRYLLPMAAAIWSTPNAGMLDFPANAFIAFFDNHRLLAGFDTLTWRTVTGGSRSYVERLLADFGGELRLGCGAARVRRHETHVEVTGSDGSSERFDHVVFAAHADEALAALEDPDSMEAELLGAIRYTPNVAVLHRDTAFMPRRQKVWSSWNYLGDTRGPDVAAVSLSYWMNRLQGIDHRFPLFVTLNPADEPAADKVFARFTYEHPRFDLTAQASQQALQAVQGTRRTWYCGAWRGYGFHEDGLASGLEVAARLGAPAPWGALGPARGFTTALAAE